MNLFFPSLSTILLEMTPANFEHFATFKSSPENKNKDIL